MCGCRWHRTWTRRGTGAISRSSVDWPTVRRSPRRKPSSGRSASRAREMSVRSAMGAGRSQLVRQLLIESLLMSALGGVVGLALSAWGVRLFDLAVANVDKPYWIDFSIDLKVIAFLAGICLLTSMLFGLAPALHSARADLNTVLRDGSRGQTGGARVKRATASLVVVQLALTVILLFGAGLMVQSFQKLRHMDLGIEPENLLTLRVGLPEAKYPESDERLAFQDRLDRALAALPGLDATTVTSHLPLNGAFRWFVEMADSPITDGHDRPRVLGVLVGPDYFDTLGTEPVRGRVFDERDGADGARVVIVNRAFAARYWPEREAIGQQLRLGQDGEGEWLTVVGIAPDVRQRNPNEVEVEPAVYVPYRQQASRFFTIVARSQIKPESLALDIQQAVQAIDADLPVYFVRTMGEVVDEQSYAYRVFSSLLGIFAVIALALSSVGIYAVMTYAVSQRLQEIGVRMAMGANSGKIVWLVLRGGLRQLIVGFLIGVPGAFALGRVLENLIVQTSPNDPATLAVIAGFLAITALAACVVPAMRAVRVDPVAALRD
ncbi:MAG: FtsX-like permease family protein [Acidobacteriota bacterium]